MYEIKAANLLSSLVRNKKQSSKLIAKSLLNDFLPNFPHGWLEKPYGKYDSDIGNYGAVTTAFCAYSLIKFIKSNTEEKLNLEIRKKLSLTFASYYALENRGYIKKNIINKSKVFNTDLIVTLVCLNYLDIIDQRSVESRLLKELCLRCINRTFNHQMPNGAFRYHDLSLDIPLLYQAMCTSLLISISKKINHPYIEISYKKGSEYLLKFYKKNNFKFYWDKSKGNDKNGSIWIYGWMPNILRTNKLFKEEEELINIVLKSFSDQDGIIPNKIEKSLSNKPDKFYTALLKLSLDMGYPDKKIPKYKYSLTKKLFINLVFSTKGFISYINCFYLQSFRKLSNMIYPKGALENEKW